MSVVPPQSPTRSHPKDSRKYWLRRLEGAPGLLELPTDRPRPPVQAHRRESHRFSVMNGIVERLDFVARKEGATLFMTLLGAFQVLLHRYTGQDDLVVGTPIANRDRPEVASMAGFFLNLLPVRTRVDGDESFRGLLGRLREGLMGDYAHAEYPFESMVEDLGLGRDAAHAPLVQVAFVHLEQDPCGLELEGLEARREWMDGGTSKWDLLLSVEGRWDGGLECVLEYDRDLFDGARMERMAGHWRTLLEGIAADPGRRVWELPMLTEGEREQVLVGWNRTEREYPQDACLHGLFEQQALRTPEAVAVEFGEERLTYRELDGRANQLAHVLRRHGVGADSLVGVCMHRSMEMVVALYGVLKAGGAYVPIDPEYPADRMAFMLEDSATGVLLTQEALAGSLPRVPGHVICLDAGCAILDGESRAKPEERAGPDSLAYMIYTSGSTGRPKGAMNTHRGICNRLLWMQERYDIGSADVVLQKTPFSFDVSVWEFFWPLLAGARLVVARPGGHRDPAYLIRVIEQTGVTVIHFVPPMLRMFLAGLGVGECRSLRHVICSGEALPFDLQESFFQRHGAALHNLYGPTEAAVDVTHWTCRRGNGRGVVPIGRPVANTAVYVLDAHLQPVPVGVPGELYLGGVQVGRGYHGRPELTAQRFIADPFSGIEGARLYKTGDLCRWLEDGTVEFLGRMDFQVKLRGFRIELGEVEAALAADPVVGECVVVAREDEPGDMRLVAYVVVREGLAWDEGTVRAGLRARMPEYMVPSAFVPMERLPLNANGKVDRKALPRPAAMSGRRDGSEAPRNDVERQLASVWQAVLGIRDVGIDESFFDLGGHSLKAMEAVGRVRSLGMGGLSLAQFFAHPTIRRQAEVLGRDIVPDGIQPVARTGPLPLSSAQRRLWLVDQVIADPTAYNQPLVYRLRGELDADRLRRSLQALVDRHEVLRTGYELVGTEPMQVIHEAGTAMVPWAVVDLGKAGEARVAAQVLEEVGVRFDLGKAPMVRGRLLRVGPGEHVLVVVFHHIACDEWTFRVLLGEWAAIYRAGGELERAGLPELGLQYADYAAWQREGLGGEAMRVHRDYWHRRLEGVPGLLELPTDRPRPPVQRHRGTSLRFLVPAGVAERVGRVGRKEGATLFMTLLGAFQVLLHRYTGQDDLVVGTPIANRDRPEVPSMAGFFLNLLPVRTRVDGDESFRGLLGRLREGLMGDYAHAEYPFESMVEDLGLGRDAAHAPLVQVAFVHLEQDPCGLELEGLEARREWMDGGTSKWDLLLSVEGRWDGGLECVLEYDRDLFDGARMERMAGHWRTLLEGIAADPGRRVWELPMLTEGEREQVLVGWNRTKREYPQEACLHGLFEQQALRTPEAVAVEFGEERLTYRELDGRAERLAWVLRGLGAKVGDRVAVLMGRSPDFVVAVLGILKAGCAYVPLDSKSPRERQLFMIRDVGASVVIVQGASWMEGTWEGEARVHAWEELLGRMVSAEAMEPLAGMGGAYLAYVMYTSGSTGVPKGVSVPHRAVARLVFGNDYLPFGPGETFALLSSTAFDASTLELWGSLLHGAKLAVCGEEVLGREDLARFLARHRVSCLWLTAAFFNVVVEGYPEALEPVRHCMTGGDALSVPHVCKALRALPGMRLVNGYGPTECTTFATTFEIPRDFDGAGGSVPIGRPIGNTRLYLLGRHGELVPVGVPGEIYLAGDGLADGYWGRPDLTAERFVDDPFSGRPGDRMYRTGDWGRYRADGTVEFLGRMDFQVKLRGFRIELGEVEAALAAEPVVGQCVVLVREDVPGDKQLVAYVVVREGQAWDEETVRAGLRARMPEYMVPSAFVPMERLPLNANGKVDRKALPRPMVAPARTGGSEPPRTDLERRLAEVWQRVLGVTGLGVHDNFFDLGGHSLKAMELALAMERELGRRVPVIDVYQAPTVSRLARLLEGNTGPLEAGGVVHLEADARGPVAFMMHGMPQHLAHILKSDCRLRGVHSPLDEEALQWLQSGRSGLTVEEVARRCVDLIRQSQATGPYHLVGFSFGGLLAFEMALQLSAAGERIGLLCLLDSLYVAGTQPARFPWLRKWAYHAGRLARGGSGYLAHRRAEKARHEEIRRQNAGKLERHAHPEIQRRAEDLWKARMRFLVSVSERYVAKAYPGDVLIVRATSKPASFDRLPERTHGWSRAVTGSLEVVDVNCGHMELLEPPHVEVVARALRARLAPWT